MVLLLGIFLKEISSDFSPKDMYKAVHSSFIHKSHKLGNPPRFINRPNNSKVHMMAIKMSITMSERRQVEDIIRTTCYMHECEM